MGDEYLRDMEDWHDAFRSYEWMDGWMAGLFAFVIATSASFSWGAAARIRFLLPGV